MALIKCPNCGREISDKADVCPHCGYSLSTAGETAEKKNKKIDKNKIISLCNGRLKYILLGIGLVAVVLILTVYISNYTAMNAVERYFEAVNEQLQDIEIVYEEPEEVIEPLENSDTVSVDTEIEDKSESIAAVDGKESSQGGNSQDGNMVEDERLEVTFDSVEMGYVHFAFTIKNTSNRDVTIDVDEYIYLNDVATNNYGVIKYQENIPAGKGTVVKFPIKKTDVNADTVTKIELCFTSYDDAGNEIKNSCVFDDLNIQLK